MRSGKRLAQKRKDSRGERKDTQRPSFFSFQHRTQILKRLEGFMGVKLSARDHGNSSETSNRPDAQTPPPPVHFVTCKDRQQKQDIGAKYWAGRDTLGASCSTYNVGRRHPRTQQSTGTFRSHDRTRRHWSTRQTHGRWWHWWAHQSTRCLQRSQEGGPDVQEGSTANTTSMATTTTARSQAPLVQRRRKLR